MRTKHSRGGALNWRTLEHHPYANLFPMMTPRELDELTAAIVHGGYNPHDPIIVHDGKILDGRNRQAACKRAGVAPVIKFFHGTDAQALAFVWEHNMARRHLSTSQKAMVAARLRTAATSEHGPRTGGGNFATLTNRVLAARLSISPRMIRKAIALVKDAPDAAADVEAGRASLNEASTRVKDPAPAKSTHPRVVGGGNNEWGTPLPYIEAARGTMGRIDLDPASNHKAARYVGADHYWTKEDDGLGEAWPDRLHREGCETDGPITVFLNPPYDNPEPWIDQLLIHWRQGNIEAAIVIVNNATETSWCQTLLATATAMCLPASRIKFLRPDGTADGQPWQAQIVFYFGDNPAAFRSEHEQFGTVGMLRAIEEIRTMPRKPAASQVHLPLVDDDDDLPALLQAASRDLRHAMITEADRQYRDAERIVAQGGAA